MKSAEGQDFQLFAIVATSKSVGHPSNRVKGSFCVPVRCGAPAAREVCRPSDAISQKDKHHAKKCILHYCPAAGCPALSR